MRIRPHRPDAESVCAQRLRLGALRFGPARPLHELATTGTGNGTPGHHLSRHGEVAGESATDNTGNGTHRHQLRRGRRPIGPSAPRIGDHRHRKRHPRAPPLETRRGRRRIGDRQHRKRRPRSPIRVAWRAWRSEQGCSSSAQSRHRSDTGPAMRQATIQSPSSLATVQPSASRSHSAKPPVFAHSTTSASWRSRMSR